MHSLPGGTPQITSIGRPDFHVEFQEGISRKRNKNGRPDHSTAKLDDKNLKQGG
jgi:hypothetical protein